MRRVDLEEVEWAEDVPGVVARWTRLRWPAIERSQRLMELRAYTFGALANRFAEALDPLSSAQVAAALAHAGLEPNLSGALTSVHGLAMIGAEVTQRAAATFGFHAPSFLDAPGEARLNDLQLDALAQFQHEYSVSPAAVGALRREAERQQLLGVLRFSLTTLGDWRDFRDQLRTERTG